jgi:hypothetical protein
MYHLDLIGPSPFFPPKFGLEDSPNDFPVFFRVDLISYSPGPIDAPSFEVTGCNFMPNEGAIGPGYFDSLKVGE